MTTETETETLELYKQALIEDRVWRGEIERLVALEVGAKMQTPHTSVSTTQRNNVLSHAKWVYLQATGRNW